MLTGSNVPASARSAPDMLAAEMETAVAALARRVIALENEHSAIPSKAQAAKLSEADSTAILVNALAELKMLRTDISLSSKQMDSRLEAMKSVEAENAKLRYQITHLKRSLDADERSASTTP
jgi:uncharacterized tellurite resistance protein B-like protein